MKKAQGIMNYMLWASMAGLPCIRSMDQLYLKAAGQKKVPRECGEFGCAENGPNLPMRCITELGPTILYTGVLIHKRPNFHEGGWLQEQNGVKSYDSWWLDDA